MMRTILFHGCLRDIEASIENTLKLTTHDPVESYQKVPTQQFHQISLLFSVFSSLTHFLSSSIFQLSLLHRIHLFSHITILKCLVIY
ncbi:uncharacterized protein DFL_000629 [Arthrobotrys flagrans]|uniref:Uncharacterized protein n=1 Tax=Arthrobotrys flagrans TaxID=97331 RepID=A0A437AFH3_ARTFL|nr:hypothetical protein DFL_000629 [Arthrobotrys flagrans]